MRGLRNAAVSIAIVSAVGLAAGIAWAAFGSTTSNGTSSFAARSDLTPWYNQAYGYRKTTTIDRTKVTGALTNFPVLISRTDSDLAAQAQSDGDDIVFTASDGVTKLSHEIETYTSGSGQLVAWVKVPSISNVSDTKIYMYYGNPSATNQQSATAVWDSNFKGVWHLEEAVTDEATTGTHSDSTSNANNAAQGGNDDVPGKISSAQDFDNVNDYIRAPNTASLQPTSAITISGWINLRTFGAAAEVDPILRKGQGGAVNYQLALHDSKPALYINGSDDTAQVASATLLTANTTYYLVATYNGATGIIYLNGASNTTSNFAYTIATDTRPAFIGGRDDSNDIVNGYVDEVRISDSVRSATWIQTEYNNQNSPSTFCSVGTVQLR